MRLRCDNVLEVRYSFYRDTKPSPRFRNRNQTRGGLYVSVVADVIKLLFERGCLVSLRHVRYERQLGFRRDEAWHYKILRQHSAPAFSFNEAFHSSTCFSSVIFFFFPTSRAQVAHVLEISANGTGVAQQHCGGYGKQMGDCIGTGSEGNWQTRNRTRPNLPLQLLHFLPRGKRFVHDDDHLLGKEERRDGRL